MRTSFPKLEDVASESALRARRRLQSLGLAGRTGLALALLGVLAVDLILLDTAEWQVAITGAQTILSLTAWGSALRKDPFDHLLPAQRRARARTALLIALFAIGFAALLQKWWIALVESELRALYTGSYRVMGATATVAALVLSFGRSRRLVRFFAAFAEQPARQTAVSFVAVALLGALLLTLPVCVRDPTHVSFLDALFMATSAVCVTGLAVHGVAVEYTTWGQAVLLVLVQIGGIGIMVLSASLVVLTGRRLKARSSAALVEVLDADSLLSLRGSIVRIVGFTLLIEAVGTLVLYTQFSSHREVGYGAESAHPMAGAGSLWWAALFHAVSAFCNAGFSLMHGGLEPFVASYGVCSTIMTLIVLGGLGFPVREHHLHPQERVLIG
jgi:trk system potassium uptake protein TrkH